MPASEPSRFIHSRNRLRLPPRRVLKYPLGILKLWLRADFTNPKRPPRPRSQNMEWPRMDRAPQSPNLEITPYIVNDPKAKYHPLANRGNEAMFHLTCLYKFYDELPDITIFTHVSDWSWHNGGTIQYCTACAIEHLDFDEVRRRNYMNMRVR